MTVAAVVLGTAMLAGCSERSGLRPTVQAEAPAQAAPSATTTPVVAAPAPSATPAASPTATVKEPAKPEPRKTARSGDARISVRRLVVAQGVRNREPVEPGTTFKSDAGKIYAFVELENRGRDAGEIVVEFEPPGGGAPHGDVTLAVGAAPRWRTWAYTRTAKVAGSWTAVVKNKQGDVLARAPFEVTL